ncbi:hypothetical protein KUTeg_014127 [Tegillarca granosa]|uniref:BZIP domain-containing protein n=1 Tax=Tegillarca granosa TaxID=220873 RepID=A0ABQ9F160_TEGGR|nr:hypothetical protein KUTeg_014127 [Tegillarca granosa]
MAEDVQPTTEELLHHRYDNEYFTNGHSIKLEPSNNHSSSEESVESPLDFSVKRKNDNDQNDNSGKESGKESPESTFNSNHENNKDYDLEDTKHHLLSNGLINHEDDTFEKGGQIGEPKPSGLGDGNGASFSSLAGMMSALQAGMVPTSSMLGAFPAMAALMDPRYTQSNNKSSRPFKSYPKDALSMPFGGYGVPGFNAFQSVDNGVLQNMNINSEELMNVYKQQILALRDRSRRSVDNISGSSIVSMQTQSRKRPRSLPDSMKDEAYWDRRRKNNEAAKRSRDARRAKEDEIAIRAALLEAGKSKTSSRSGSIKNRDSEIKMYFI